MSSLINWLKAKLFSFKYTLKALGIKDWIYVILFLLGPIISGVFVGVSANW